MHRDQIAETIANAYEDCLGPELTADAVLALWQPHTIETRDELAAVPLGAIVRSSAGTVAARFDSERGVVFGDDRPFPWQALGLPMTVLWVPEVTG